MPATAPTISAMETSNSKDKSGNNDSNSNNSAAAETEYDAFDGFAERWMQLCEHERSISVGPYELVFEQTMAIGSGKQRQGRHVFLLVCLFCMCC